MQTYLIFSTSTPILVISTFPSPDSPGFIERLTEMGIDRFVCFRAPLGKAREIYGMRYEQLADEIEEENDIQVLDYNGFTAFKNFDIDELELTFKYQTSPGDAEAQGTEG